MGNQMVVRLHAMVSGVRNLVRRYRIPPRFSRNFFRMYSDWIFAELAGIPCWNKTRRDHATHVLMNSLRSMYGLRFSTPAVCIWHSLGLMSVECLIYKQDQQLFNKWWNTGNPEWLHQALTRMDSVSEPDLYLRENVTTTEMWGLVQQHMRVAIARRLEHTQSMTYLREVNRCIPWVPKLAKFMKKPSWRGEFLRRAAVDAQEWLQNYLLMENSAIAQ